MDSLATLGSRGCEEASLEYAPGLLQTERGRSLHGFTAVAPLKRDGAPREADVSGSFPPVHETLKQEVTAYRICLIPKSLPI